MRKTGRGATMTSGSKDSQSRQSYCKTIYFEGLAITMLWWSLCGMVISRESMSRPNIIYTLGRFFVWHNISAYDFLGAVLPMGHPMVGLLDGRTAMSVLKS